MTVTQTGRRMAFTGLLALAASLLPLSAANAQLTADDTAYVVGDTNTEASIKHSRLTYTPLEGDVDSPATEVLIGTADTFADNLAAGTLSGQALEGGRPLFLNDSDSSVSQEILDEIARVTNGAEGVTAHILGGTAAQGEGVADDLEAAGYTVNRFAGATRTETAIAIAEATDNTTVMVVRAFAAADSTDATQAFADSLTAGAVAATLGYDVVFTQTEVLTGSTAAYLAEAGYESAIVVGGTAAISEETEAEVAALIEDTTRVSGATRFDTQIALNELRETPVGPFAIVVDGQEDDAWANAFSAANWSGLANAPVVLTNQGELPQQTEDYLVANHESTFAAHGAANFAFCGTNVTPELCQEIADLQGGTTSEFDAPPPVVTEDPNSGVLTDTDADGTAPDSYDFTSETGDLVTVTLSTADALANDEFTVDGVSATSGAFFAAATPGDTVTFTEDGAANGTNDLHELVNVAPTAINEGVVGNVDIANNQFDIIEPVSGVALRSDITYTGGLFQVDGAAATELTFEAAANEGDTVVITPDAPNPTTYAITNQTISGAAGTVTNGAPATFTIDAFGDDPATNADTLFSADAAGDTFVVNGVAGNQAAFDAALSAGDTVTYARNGGVENYTLVDAAPTPVEGTLTEVFDEAANTATVVDGATDRAIAYTPASTTFLVDGILATEAQAETALTAGDAIVFQAADAATSTTARLEITNQALTGTPVATTLISNAAATADVCDAGECVFDIENAETGVVYDDFSYLDGANPLDVATATDTRYFTVSASGTTTEVTEDGFNDALVGLTAAQFDALPVSVTATGLSTNITITLPA